jgi:hypothetical protein
MSACALTLGGLPNGLVQHVQTLILMKINHKSLTFLPHVRKEGCIYLEWPDLRDGRTLVIHQFPCAKAHGVAARFLADGK